MALLRPPASLRFRLAHRLAARTGRAPILPAMPPWVEPSWDEKAPGIASQPLTLDEADDPASGLVRLAPGASYGAPNSGRGEWHLLEGELWIGQRKLLPGESASTTSAASPIWSRTGCICVFAAVPGQTLLPQ